MRQQPVPPVALLGVYRCANESTVLGLLRSFAPSQVALWALDRPAESLAEHTVGSGPGARPVLLNKLYCHLRNGRAPSERVFVVCDDDVRINRAHARLFLKIIKRANLDVAQPSHVYRSYTSWAYVRRKPFTLARLTAFLEQGPIFAVSSAGAAQFFPLREDLGMGWGLEAGWARLAIGGARLGVVDAVGMRHLNPVSGAYDRSIAEDTAQRALAEAGFDSFAAMQVTLERWRPTSTAPTWVRGRRRPDTVR
jgi:hypothetical protein